MSEGGDGRRAWAAPRLSIVVVGTAHEGLARTLSVLTPAPGIEVLPVRSWPRASGTPDDGPHRVLWAPGVGDAAAANAGIAAARGERVLLLRAGDEPRPGAVEAHASGGGRTAIVGRIAPRPGRHEPVEDGWCGVRPADGLPRAARFSSYDRATLVRAGGLDDRLRDLDVAAHELLARLRSDGEDVVDRPDLVADAPDLDVARQRRDALAAGRSAHVLAVLELERGAPRPSTAERVERGLLAWVEPAAVLASTLTHHSVPWLERLSLRAAFARGRGLPPLPVRPGDRLGLPDPPPADRPPIAVVVPFAGSEAEAEEVLDALATIERRPGDELVVVDNARVPLVRARDGIRVVRAGAEWSSYHARNVGWRATAAPWLLFVDADCRPAPWLLDAYFAPAPGPQAGAVAGSILDAPGPSLAERYSQAVGVLRQSAFLAQQPKGFAATANLLVRRSALEELGGFTEGIRSSGDADASHRLQDAGWCIEHRPRAAVVHLHRVTLRDLVKQYRRYVAGVSWLRQRFPYVAPDWPPHPIGPLRPVPAHLAGARFGSAVVQALTAWTMWRARCASAEDNVAERPAVAPAPEPPRPTVAAGGR